MNIAISTFVTPPKLGGVGYYLVNLLRALERVDTDNEYFILVGTDTRNIFTSTADNFHMICLPLAHDPRWLMRPAYYAWQNSLAYFTFRRRRIDVLHLPNLLPHVMRFVPTVITIHDLAEYYVPGRYPRLRRLYRMQMSRYLAHNSERIIAISQSTKMDLLTLTGAQADNIDVVHEAAPIRGIVTEADVESICHRYSLRPQGYLLYVGKMLPHKNLKRLIEAFGILIHRHKIAEELVIVGEHDHHTELLKLHAAQLGVEHKTHFAGYVPEHELPALYRGAKVFVFPSLYEGFGLPVLESMIQSTPVVTSNISSLPEIAGDAALFVDPYSTGSIANGILQILKDRDLREMMIQRGERRAKEFTWEQCARQTIESYRRALKNGTS